MCQYIAVTLIKLKTQVYLRLQYCAEALFLKYFT
jgi:hypothetical protein